MSARRLFSQEIAQSLISYLLPLRDPQFGYPGTGAPGQVFVPGLRTVQQGRFSQFRATAELNDIMDFVMVIPFLTSSALGPSIQNTNSQYLYRIIYIRKMNPNEFVNQNTNAYTETMVETLMNHPDLDNITVPGLQIIRAWPERIEWEPEEDRLFEGKLDAQIDTTAWNVIVDTKAARF